MLPAKLTPVRVLWLVSFCLLFLTAFAPAAQASPGKFGAPTRVHHGRCPLHVAHTLAAQPIRRTVDDSNDDESDDLIGDSWLAPCAMPVREALPLDICESADPRQPQPCKAARSFTAIDPFAPRPPPARFQL